ncbi:MAG: hypothetical protein RI922_2310 [Bacteroidota bacterium]|jgi:hypothetical protein
MALLKNLFKKIKEYKKEPSVKRQLTLNSQTNGTTIKHTKQEENEEVTQIPVSSPNSFLFPKTETVELVENQSSSGHFYPSNEAKDLSTFTYLEMCSVAAYILRNLNYQTLIKERFFKEISINFSDPDADLFKDKASLFIGKNDCFSVEGYHYLITIAKGIKPDFITQVISNNTK